MFTQREINQFSTDAFIRLWPCSSTFKRREKALHYPSQFQRYIKPLGMLSRNAKLYIVSTVLQGLGSGIWGVIFYLYLKLPEVGFQPNFIGNLFTVSGLATGLVAACRFDHRTLRHEKSINHRFDVKHRQSRSDSDVTAICASACKPCLWSDRHD
jgi:hypothetical protein